MPIMRILKGPPATGKTTYRKELVAQGWSYVNLDELRLDYPTVTECGIHQIQRGFILMALERNENIVIDNLNLNPKTTARYEELARRYNYTVEYKLFGTDLHWSEAVKRDSARDAKVGKSVIIQHYMNAGLYNDSKRAAVIFDIDGTLADITHRRHFVTDLPEGRKKDWKSFFAGIPNDAPNKPIKTLYDMVCAAENHLIFGKGAPEIVPILVSGRASEHRRVTEIWLETHGINDYFMLLMRGFNDKRDDTIVKQELYHKYIKPHFDVLFVIDDRPRVLRMWRAEGLATFDCGNGIEF